MDDINRLLGEHSAELKSLNVAVSSVASDVKCLLADKNSRDGSRRTIFTISAAVGTAAGALVSALAAALHH